MEALWLCDVERATADCPVMDEVTGPDIVLKPGRLLDTAIGTGPAFRAQFPGFSQPQGPSQSQAVPEPANPLEIHRPAPTDQQGMNAAVAVTRMPPRQSFDLTGQR